jgi:hypothetical protein
MISAIKKLKENRIVTTTTSRPRNVLVTSTCSPNVRTNERTNGKPEFDFELVYQIYPRKEGKQIGLKKCITGIKTKEQYDRLIKSVNNYKSLCEKNKTELKFIKLFSSFMSSWEDYIELPTELKKPSTDDYWKEVFKKNARAL